MTFTVQTNQDGSAHHRTKEIHPLHLTQLTHYFVRSLTQSQHIVRPKFLLIPILPVKTVFEPGGISDFGAQKYRLDSCFCCQVLNTHLLVQSIRTLTYSLQVSYWSSLCPPETHTSESSTASHIPCLHFAPIFCIWLTFLTGLCKPEGVKMIPFIPSVHLSSLWLSDPGAMAGSGLKRGGKSVLYSEHVTERHC